MLAGGWKTSRMVAHYAAGATAERGAPSPDTCRGDAMRAEIEVSDRAGAAVRLQYGPDGWRSNSASMRRLVSELWDAFDWPGYQPGKMEAFLTGLPNAKLVSIAHSPPPSGAVH